MAIEVDILEDYIYNLSPELLTTLLKDHTTSREGEPQRNIFWAPRTTNIWARTTATIPPYFPILSQARTAASSCRAC